MPFGPEHRRVNLTAYLILATGIAIAVGLGYHQLRQEARHRINVVNHVALKQCQEIENIKAEFRQDARQDYRRLSQTLKLLGIKKTPAIQARARRDKNETLRRFASGHCPREVLRQ